MNPSRLLLVPGALALVLTLVSCQARQTGSTASRPSPRAIADSLARMAALDRGKEAFVAYCAMCHGDGGNGDGDVAGAILKKTGIQVARLNDRELVGPRSEKEIAEVIAKGGAHTGRSNLMPAWGERLDPVVIADIAAFVKSLADSNPAIPRATIEHYLSAPPGVPAEGRVLFLHHCSACHGAYGKGDGSYGDVLWSTHQVRPRNLTDSTYLAAKSDEQLFATISLGGGHFRKSAFMPSWTGTMTPAQIKSVASYVREISHTAARP